MITIHHLAAGGIYNKKSVARPPEAYTIKFFVTFVSFKSFV